MILRCTTAAALGLALVACGDGGVSGGGGTTSSSSSSTTTTTASGEAGGAACGADPSAPDEVLADTTDPAHGVFTLDEALAGLPEGPGPLRAVIDTDLGTITCTLRPDVAPNGVANFVGLARGLRPWKDPKAHKWVKRRFYDGLIFHRVIPGFVAQGGDPLGTGYGGPGYEFADEIGALKHQPGTLAYANSGADTNGSQFYIAEVELTHLDGDYTIFGQCTPIDVVESLTHVTTNASDKPLLTLHMKTVTITRCAGDSPAECQGSCATASAPGWEDPSLLWLGDEKDAPACPASAATVAFEGHAELTAPIDCGTCSCAAPTGSCALPTTMTANAASCALTGTSTPQTPFDPTSGWSGACDNQVAIPPAKLCAGVPCVQSLTVGALQLSEAGCTPSATPAQPAPTWSTFARACRVPFALCPDGASLCIADPQAGLGFRACIFHDGDVECPSSTPYLEKHVLYGGVDDTRACSACTCEAPAGSTCAATVTVAGDGACSAALVTANLTAQGPDCHDLPPGTALGSKSATAPVYTAGTCTPGGGQPSGAATPKTPATYCCIPPGQP